MPKFQRMEGPGPKAEQYNQVIDLIQTNFPNFTSYLPNVTIKPVSFIDNLTNGDYDPKTKTIRIAVTKGNFQDQVRTVLHELTHAQEDTPEGQATKLPSSFDDPTKDGRVLTDSRIGAMDSSKNQILAQIQKNMIQQADQLDFPSVIKGAEDSENRDEILATLRASTEMNKRGFNNRYDGAVAQLMKNPDIAAWVKRNENITVPQSNITGPTTADLSFDDLIDSFKSVITGYLK